MSSGALGRHNRLMIDKIALIASVILPLWNIPLIMRIIKRRSARDISLYWAIGVWVSLLAMLPSGIRNDFIVWKVFTICNFLLFSFVLLAAIIFHNK